MFVAQQERWNKCNQSAGGGGYYVIGGSPTFFSTLEGIGLKLDALKSGS